MLATGVGPAECTGELVSPHKKPSDGTRKLNSKSGQKVRAPIDSQTLQAFARKLHIDPSGILTPRLDLLDAAYRDLVSLLLEYTWDPEMLEILESDRIPAFAVINWLEVKKGHSTDAAAWAIYWGLSRGTLNGEIHTTHQEFLKTFTGIVGFTEEEFRNYVGILDDENRLHLIGEMPYSYPVLVIWPTPELSNWRKLSPGASPSGSWLPPEIQVRQARKRKKLPPYEGWYFEPGVAWFRNRRYECKPKPLELLKEFVDAPRSSWEMKYLKGILTDDMMEDATLRQHLAELRKVLRAVARDNNVQKNIEVNPLPYKNGGWQFLLPRD